MFRFLTALQFLTRLPVRLERPPTSEDLAASMVWYPVVGLILGGTGVGVGLAIGGVAPKAPSLVALVIVALWIGLTGAFHLDGLADTFDGLLCGRTGAEAGEVMKDSRIGTMGAVAVFLVLSAKIVATGHLVEIGQWRAILLAPAIARWWVVLATWQGRSPEWCRSGIGRDLDGKVTISTVLISGAMLSGMAVLVAWPFAWVPLVLAACGVSSLLVLWAHRIIGGMTGDVLGAGIETAEAAALVVAVFFAPG